MTAAAIKAPELMEPAAAGRALESALANPQKPMTIADAAAQSGLPLRDAERGLHWLTSEYRGHLRVTDEGELLFLFPNGFTRPWEDRDRVRKLARRAGRALLGASRFAVRAWLTIVMLVYVAAFVAVLIALLFASNGNSSNRSSSSRGGRGMLDVLFRVVIDAMYWTFHPFSPVRATYVGAGTSGWGRDRRGGYHDDLVVAQEVPFYERVDRFVFGPTEPHEDERAVERLVLAEIRAQKGRIGVADVMRVTGLPREQADPIMARLMLDYEGDVHVSDAGGITYSFEALRRTAGSGAGASRPEPAWARRGAVPPLTGNTAGGNLGIVALNAFNLLMAYVSLSLGLTVANVVRLVRHVPLEKLPFDGAAIALGVVPLIFSVLVFAAPIARAAARPLRRRREARETGRLALLREVLARSGRGKPVTEQALAEAYQRAAGTKPRAGELTRVVVELGGDVEPDQGEVRYRFADLEAEAEALAAERQAASEREARVGPVVFASDR